jgi:ATP-dependent DNA helicase PIF1
LEKNINISFNNSDIKPTILYPNNVDVDLINKKELDKLKGKSKVFLATYNKKVNNYLLEKLKDYNILLCVGAQIMITKNISIENELINGTRGIIIDIKETSVIIKTENNIYEINLYSQDVPNDYVKNLKILFMPIKLAYAITIHKSQGATIDYLSIDIGKKIFSYGQAYTALSRGKSLKNINIISLDEMAFQAHPIVLKWINQHH